MRPPQQRFEPPASTLEGAAVTYSLRVITWLACVCLSGCTFGPTYELSVHSTAWVLLPGESATLYVTLRDSNKELVGSTSPDFAAERLAWPHSHPVTWSSLHPEIASVSDQGQVVAHAPGRTTIRAVAQELEAVSQIEVRVARESATGVTSIVTSKHTCVLFADGTPGCWGDNWYGQVGRGRGTAYAKVLSPLLSDSGLRFRSLTAGFDHTCGLTDDGKAYCWGDNQLWQFGNPDAPRDARDGNAYPVATTSRLTEIVSGVSDTCALDEDGRVLCWGDNFSGSLGPTFGSPVRQPRPLNTSARFTQLSSYLSHTCGLTLDRVAYCWGNNSMAELGLGYISPAEDAKPVATDLRFATIRVGSSHSCGIATDGETYCWGDNQFGQLGDGTRQFALRPVRVQGGHRFTHLTAGTDFTCGLTEPGEAYCWGTNLRAQLGTGVDVTAPDVAEVAAAVVSPVPVETALRFKAISANLRRACAVTVEGTAHCWGEGPLGDGRQEIYPGTRLNLSSIPVPVVAPFSL